MARMALVDNGTVVNIVEVGPDTDPAMFNGDLVPVVESVLIGFIYNNESGEFSEPESFPDLTEEELAKLVESVPVAPIPTEE